MKSNNTAPYLESKRLHVGPDRSKSDSFGKNLTNASKKVMDPKFKKDIKRKPGQRGSTTDNMV